MIYAFVFNTGFNVAIEEDSLEEAISEIKRIYDKGIFERHGSYQVFKLGVVHKKIR